jgi:hypothetical protein
MHDFRMLNSPYMHIATFLLIFYPYNELLKDILIIFFDSGVNGIEIIMLQIDNSMYMYAKYER